MFATFTEGSLVRVICRVSQNVQDELIGIVVKAYVYDQIPYQMNTRLAAIRVIYSQSPIKLKSWKRVGCKNSLIFITSNNLVNFTTLNSPIMTRYCTQRSQKTTYNVLCTPESGAYSKESSIITTVYSSPCPSRVTYNHTVYTVPPYAYSKIVVPKESDKFYGGLYLSEGIRLPESNSELIVKSTALAQYNKLITLYGFDELK